MVDKLDEWIVRDPEILGGTPCIRGTRLNVYAVAARLKGSETARDILDGYPDLPDEAVHAAAAFAEAHPLVEHPDARPWRKAPVVKKSVA